MEKSDKSTLGGPSGALSVRYDEVFCVLGGCEPSPLPLFGHDEQLGRVVESRVQLFHDVVIGRALIQYLRAVILKNVDWRVFMFQLAPQPLSLAYHQLTDLEPVEANDDRPGLLAGAGFSC